MVRGIEEKLQAVIHNKLSKRQLEGTSHKMNGTSVRKFARSAQVGSMIRIGWSQAGKVKFDLAGSHEPPSNWQPSDNDNSSKCSKIIWIVIRHRRKFACLFATPSEVNQCTGQSNVLSSFISSFLSSAQHFSLSPSLTSYDMLQETERRDTFFCYVATDRGSFLVCTEQTQWMHLNAL